MVHVYEIKTHIIEDEKNVDYIVIVHQLPTIIFEYLTYLLPVHWQLSILQDIVKF